MTSQQCLDLAHLAQEAVQNRCNQAALDAIGLDHDLQNEKQSTTMMESRCSNRAGESGSLVKIS